MNEKVLTCLEFDKLLNKVAAFAESSMGKRSVNNIRPSSDIKTIQRLQEETDRAIGLILSYGNPPLFGINELKSATKRASLGGVLTMGQLLEIAESLRVSRSLIDYCKDADFNACTGLIRSLFTQRGLEEEIENAIDSEERMNDSASDKLFTIRRNISIKQGQIRTKLNDIMVQAAKGGHLSENLITVREGRYVLPVKASSRSSFRGLVHDKSSSGATIFMEPLACVELNNQIRDLEIEEKEEIRKLLADLSMEVSAFSSEIGGNQDLLQYIDMTFAKAKYSLDMGGSRPVFTDDRSIDLIEAKHPLLSGKVVPIDIKLGKDFNTIIITGPNTGGKTVSLKTLGLIQLMGQSGLQIPCRNNSSLGIFDEIYADIGDKQSIEQSLSTFSASMKNIVQIMKVADDRSLVLFDEIGAGTDPVEGAALAIAILEGLTEKGIRTAASTHYSELKLFAIRAKGVQNASVEFDVKSLSPTYRLIIGLPGRSNAFEISRRLGMPDDILKSAEKKIEDENIQFEDVLADIENKRKSMEYQRRQMEAERQNYSRKLKKMQEDLNSAQSRYEKGMEEAREMAAKLIDEAKEKAQSMIREAKKAREFGRGTADLDRSLSRINEEAKSIESKMPAAAKRKISGPPKDLRVGEKVEIISMGQEGILVGEPDKDGNALVQMGILKVNSKLDNLRRVEETEEEKSKNSVTGVKFVRSEGVSNFSSELDLRGERYGDALNILDKYLDQACLENISRVRIIHGKGSGALRKGVHEFLKTYPGIASYKFADVREGGSGVTIVDFK